jgi:hypothetical protein
MVLQVRVLSSPHKSSDEPTSPTLPCVHVHPLLTHGRTDKLVKACRTRCTMAAATCDGL